MNEDPAQPPPAGESDREPTNRTFLWVWLTQSGSIVGSFVTYFGIVLWLSGYRFAADDQTSDLAFALAALTIALAIPALVGIPFIGVWVDRSDRKRLMVGANLANAAVGAALAAIMLGGGLEALGIWPLLLLMAANSFLTQLHMAALDASMVMIVPKAKLGRANGMFQTVWSIGDVLAPAIVVGFVALPKLLGDVDVLGPIGTAFGKVNHGAALAVAFDALTFLVAAIILSFLTIPSPAKAARPVAQHAGGKNPGLLTEAKAGLAFIRSRKSLLSLLSIFTVANLASGPMFLLLPLLVRTNLSESWDGLGLSYDKALAILTMAASVGGVLGGVVMTTWGGFQGRRFLGVLIPVLGIGALQIVVGLSNLIYLTAALLALVTFGEPFVRAHAQAIWQSQTPPELQGRVYAVRTLVAGALIPLGSAVAGWAGGLIGPGAVITVLGVVLTCFGVAQLFNGWLWRMDSEAAAQEAAAETASGRVTATVGD